MHIFKQSIRILVAIAIVLGALVFTPAGQANASTLTVTNVNDSGAGSLRQAIADAVSGDTINISATGTIFLTSGELAIGDKNLTIQGPGAGQLVISGNNNTRVFNISASTGNTVEIADLTIQNGYAANGAGGGVYSASGATLKLTRVAVKSNVAGEVGGTTYNFGGGIYAIGTIHIIDSEISDNILRYGTGTTQAGGAYLKGSITMRNVTVSGNTAGQADNFSGEGGGIEISSGSLANLSNVTIADNTSYGSGGGIYIHSAAGSVVFSNTIIADNSSDWAPDCYGTAVSAGYNLIEDVTGCTINGDLTGNVTGSDPLLNPLAANGAATRTHSYQSGSLVWNAGNNDTCESTDQRGIHRPQGAACDIGAFEDEIPQVISIMRTDNNPTFATTVGFDITFSEPVTEVDLDDFQPIATGSLSNVTENDFGGSNTSYHVSVDIGSGVGALYLALFDNDTIVDSVGNPLGGPGLTNGDCLSGQVYDRYEANTTSSFRSIGTSDGYILESSENSNTGGTLNSVAGNILIGDGTNDRQYVGILNFNTSSLPDNAIIASAVLQIKRAGVSGTNPFNTHGNLLVEIALPFFGTGAGLRLSDFQAPASAAAGMFDPAIKPGKMYTATLDTSALQFVNPAGTTQFRLKFSLDDNDDNGQDTLSFYSGNYVTTNYRPLFTIYYYAP